MVLNSAWEIYWGEMYYSQEADIKRACGFVIETDSWYSNEDFEWMQCTWLKDSKWNLIYEWDVVYLAWQWNTLMGFPFIDLYESSFEWGVWEIIWNVRENPRLLDN